jgi:hypothetical protein
MDSCGLKVCDSARVSSSNVKYGKGKYALVATALFAKNKDVILKHDAGMNTVWSAYRAG